MNLVTFVSFYIYEHVYTTYVQLHFMCITQFLKWQELIKLSDRENFWNCAVPKIQSKSRKISSFPFYILYI